jgi:ferredoxin
VRVWIEQEFCTGDGLCEDLCSDVFEMRDDGLAHVKGEDTPNAGKPGVNVPEAFDDGVLDAQSQCAGECIYAER